MLKPIFSSSKTISLRQSSAPSTGAKSKYPPLSLKSNVGLPFSSSLNRKNSGSSPTLNALNPNLFIFLTFLFKIPLGSPTNGSPFGKYMSQINIATFPKVVCSQDEINHVS